MSALDCASIISAEASGASNWIPGTLSDTSLPIDEECCASLSVGALSVSAPFGAYIVPASCCVKSYLIY